MKIDFRSNTSFGYNKKLNNALVKRLEESPKTPLYDSISSINEQCNKIEETIVGLEKQKNGGVDENENVINLLLEYFFEAKASLCSIVDKIFPDLNYLKKSIDSYDRESIKVTDFREEKFHKTVFEDDIDKKAYQWRELLIDELTALEEDKAQRVVTPSKAQELFNKEKEKTSINQIEEKNVRKYIPSQDSPKSLDDVIGLDDCKEDIEDLIIYPLNNPEQAYKRKEDYGIEIPSFILFHGAPGCGKTMLAQAISAQTGCEMYLMDISSVGSAYLNESSQNIANAFDFISKKAKESDKPVILFMDELDSLLSKRENSSASSKEDNKVVNTLLPLIVEAKDKNIVIIGATNTYDFLDPAAKSRVNFEAYIGLPKENEIKKLLKTYLSKINMGQNLSQNDKELEELSRQLLGYSPRTIKEIFKKTGRIASRKNEQITKEDFLLALEKGSFEKINERDYLPESRKTGNVMGFIPSKNLS